jgi:septation ring formation regulator EzrA
MVFNKSIEPLQSMDDTDIDTSDAKPDTSTKTELASVDKPISSMHTIETNMMYMNNKINELQEKYKSMDVKITAIRSDMSKVTQNTSEANKLVGSAPIKIDTRV